MDEHQIVSKLRKLSMLMDTPMDIDEILGMIRAMDLFPFLRGSELSQKISVGRWLSVYGRQAGILRYGVGSGRVYYTDKEEAPMPWLEAKP